MGVELIEAPPSRSFIAGALACGKDWYNWFDKSVWRRLNATPEIFTPLAVRAATAALGATPIKVPTSSGLYAVFVSARIVQAATVNSTLTPAISYIRNGQGITETFAAALTGNTVATASGLVFVVRADANQAINLSAAYGSVGATPMAYDLDAIAVAMAAVSS